MKVERVSYDVYDALGRSRYSGSNSLEAGYSLGSLIKYTFLNPIKFDNVRRNEVASKIPKPNPSTVMSKEKTSFIILSMTVKNRQQRATTLLRGRRLYH